MNQGRRDSYLGAAVSGGVFLLCVLGLVLITTAAHNTWLERLLGLFGLLELVVVVILTIWFGRGLSASPLSGCAVPLIFLVLLGAGFVLFIAVCERAVVSGLSGPFH
jgi:hypothetical protein